ncbi:hypothetical protein [Motiliproteus sp.]|uniref:hypothetical protein n=1 Tax=Motiliproteus sp. TaxID=1898955 RepID=UPI003BA98381
MIENPTGLQRLIGWMMLSAVLLSVAAGLGWLPGFYSGGLAWCCGLLLFGRVGGFLRLQVLCIFLIGCAALWWGLDGRELPWAKLLATNQILIAMLIAVSFLRLVTALRADPQEQLPMGRGALWRTLLGVHLFGAVINMSTLQIVGERLSRRQPLTPQQGVLLSRGFALASLWSPFFVAMGVALTHADGAQLETLSLAGLPAAAVALLVAGIGLSRHPGVTSQAGYPIHFEALWLPLLLAVLVFGARGLWPDVPVLSWVSLLSLLLCLLVLVLRSGTQRLASMRRHVEAQLPTMGGELALFLAAGVLTVGLAQVVERSGFDWPLQQFGPWQAWGLLWMILVAAVMGIHPLISIATSGGILAPQVQDPNLLGMTFLMGWAVGIIASPVSGTHLTLQARFGLSAFGFPRWNLGFVLQLMLICLLALHGYAWFRAG